MPITRRSEVICSLTSSPLRDLTVSTSPSTASMVPRTRDGDVCWATAYDDRAKRANPASKRENVERQDNLERWMGMSYFLRILLSYRRFGASPFKPSSDQPGYGHKAPVSRAAAVRTTVQTRAPPDTAAYRDHRRS